MDPLWAGREGGLRTPAKRLAGVRRCGSRAHARGPLRLYVFEGGALVHFLRLCLLRLGLRLVGDPVALLGRNESITDVPDGPDQRLVLGSELGAQASYVHVDRSGAAEVVVAPDLLEQLRAREDAARVLGEVLQELELLEGEVEDPALELRGVGGLVDGEVAVADLHGGVVVDDLLAAHGEPQ